MVFLSLGTTDAMPIFFDDVADDDFADLLAAGAAGFVGFAAALGAGLDDLAAGFATAFFAALATGCGRRAGAAAFFGAGFFTGVFFLAGAAFFAAGFLALAALDFCFEVAIFPHHCPSAVACYSLTAHQRQPFPRPRDCEPLYSGAYRVLQEAAESAARQSLPFSPVVLGLRARVDRAVRRVAA